MIRRNQRKGIRLRPRADEVSALAASRISIRLSPGTESASYERLGLRFSKDGRGKIFKVLIPCGGGASNLGWINTILKALSEVVIDPDSVEEEPIPPQCPDRIAYLPALNPQEQCALCRALLKKSPHFGSKELVRVSEALIQIDAIEPLIDALLLEKRKPLATKIVRARARQTLFCINLADSLFAQGLVAKTWVKLMRQAHANPDRNVVFRSKDKIVLLEDPQPEVTKKFDAQLDQALRKLETGA